MSNDDTNNGKTGYDWRLEAQAIRAAQDGIVRERDEARAAAAELRKERDAARAEVDALKLSLEAETKYSAALADQIYDLNKGERD